MKNFIELFGWYGAFALILGYALVSFSVLQSTDIMYQLLNATGALGIVVVSFYKRAYQPGIVNVIWATIAVVAMLNIVL